MTWVFHYHLGLKTANAGDMMEMEVPATNTRRLVRRSTMEPAAKDNPAPASRVPATGATGKKKGLLLSSTWVYCCHLGLITANAGGMLEMEVPATNTMRLVRRSTTGSATSIYLGLTLRRRVICVISN